MAITKPVKPKTPESFISGAPDAASARAGGVRRGTKQQITLTIAPELLAKVDELAQRMGQSRAALINLAIYRTIEPNLLDLDAFDHDRARLTHLVGELFEKQREP